MNKLKETFTQTGRYFCHSDGILKEHDFKHESLFFHYFKIPIGDFFHE